MTCIYLSVAHPIRLGTTFVFSVVLFETGLAFQLSRGPTVAVQTVVWPS
jgi:hypothetical protein